MVEAAWHAGVSGTAPGAAVSELTRSLREALIGHQMLPPDILAQCLVELEEHEARIGDLKRQLDLQYERFSNQVAGLRRELDRVKGVHGA